MKNIEKLKEIWILWDVRQRLWADNEDDDSRDHRLDDMDNKDLIAQWVWWNMWDESWAHSIINKYNILEDLDK